MRKVAVGRAKVPLDISLSFRDSTMGKVDHVLIASVLMVSAVVVMFSTDSALAELYNRGGASVQLVQGVMPPRFEGTPDTWVFEQCISPHGYLNTTVPQGKRAEIAFSVRNCGVRTSFAIELEVVSCPVGMDCQLPKRIVTVDPAGYHVSESFVVVVDVPPGMRPGSYLLQIKGSSGERTRYVNRYIFVGTSCIAATCY